MDEFAKGAVVTALKKMFRGSHFNICTFDQCLKITGAIPDGHVYDSLSVLHCVNWRDMPPSLRDEVYQRTLETFQRSGFLMHSLDMIFNEGSGVFELKKPPKKSFRVRLLGGGK